jgi:hypothetical protein
MPLAGHIAAVSATWYTGSSYCNASWLSSIQWSFCNHRLRRKGRGVPSIKSIDPQCINSLIFALPKKFPAERNKYALFIVAVKIGYWKMYRCFNYGLRCGRDRWGDRQRMGCDGLWGQRLHVLEFYGLNQLGGTRCSVQWHTYRYCLVWDSITIECHVQLPVVATFCLFHGHSIVSGINAIKRKPPQKHTTHFKQTTAEKIRGVK